MEDVDPLLAIDKFRLALSESQVRGCLRETENERLRRTIVEYFPLPPAIAYFLQMVSYDITGYFHLTPDFRMQITSPIYPPGTEPSTKTLLGYESQLYFFAKDLTTKHDSDWRLRPKFTSVPHQLKNGLCVTNCLFQTLPRTFDCYSWRMKLPRVVSLAPSFYPHPMR